MKTCMDCINYNDCIEIDSENLEEDLPEECLDFKTGEEYASKEEM
jgi:hypothetical protein